MTSIKTHRTHIILGDEHNVSLAEPFALLETERRDLPKTIEIIGSSERVTVPAGEAAVYHVLQVSRRQDAAQAAVPRCKRPRTVCNLTCCVVVI